MTEIYTVSRLNDRIRDRLSGDPRLRDLWARGELSNVKNHISGHRYFTLKDQESQISCVLFRSQAVNLGFELKDGQNVLVYGDVEVYRPKGTVQVLARSLRLDQGIGLRFQEVEALKARLESEGLFSADRKRVLPRYPSTIGVVTSLDGAALRDVMKIIGAYPCRMIISPAQVQGEGAAESVAQALRALGDRVDVTIVCRGGGSVEDLWPFNAEIVARAIYESPCPVVSAIGHETDVTIADFVADIRAPTPTAAARMVVPVLEEVRDLLQQIERRMNRGMEAGLDRHRNRLDYLARGFSPRRTSALVAERRRQVDELSARLSQSQKASMRDLGHSLQELKGRLQAVSPLATLSRGYALVRKGDGSLVCGSDEVLPGEKIEVLLSWGRLLCRVEGKDADR